MSKADILGSEFARDFRKGLLKMFILKMLSREDMHGYAMISRIEEACGWKASPGSIYPALMNLTAQGHIKVKVAKMRKMYTITAKGREYIALLDDNFERGLNELSKIYNGL